jgi:hypothetical protein
VGKGILPQLHSPCGLRDRMITIHVNTPCLCHLAHQPMAALLEVQHLRVEVYHMGGSSMSARTRTAVADLMHRLA